MLDHWKQVYSATNPKAGAGKEKKGKLHIKISFEKEYCVYSRIYFVLKCVTERHDRVIKK